ncbi:hypothetical protein FOZ63_027482 [Perkinsus olseni]|uniref:Uncharacterized protein n=1 Tax=Perkinsus olseni TaxID=32597 RepID=A0A7J6NA54_PEROL|nr:hypothetical protein FOZ63_027482 [Perkinsus olseni]
MTNSTIKVRFNWLHRGLLLLAYTAVMALSNESYTVLADHPPGCNGGPGSASTSDDIEILNGTCVYMMGGLNADGEKARSIGLLIKSNLPDSELGDYGTLKLQWNIVEGDTSPTGFSMESADVTQLSLGTDEVFLRLALTSNDIVGTFDHEGKFVMKISSHVLAYFNEALHEHANLATRWADAVASAGHSFSTRHALVVTQLSHDSYHIRFSFGAEGTYVTSEGVERSFNIDKNIVEGALYY